MCTDSMQEKVDTLKINLHKAEIFEEKRLLLKELGIYLQADKINIKQ